jgi:hypothetical protein
MALLTILQRLNNKLNGASYHTILEACVWSKQQCDSHNANVKNDPAVSYDAAGQGRLADHGSRPDVRKYKKRSRADNADCHIIIAVAALIAAFTAIRTGIS